MESLNRLQERINKLPESFPYLRETLKNISVSFNIKTLAMKITNSIYNNN
jgi:hypothetical protein